MAGRQIFDIEADAKRAFDAIQNGGIAIVPNTIGYSILGGTEEALKRIFVTKQRRPEKLNAMLADVETHRGLHKCSERGYAIVDTIISDYDLPLGCIAPLNHDHPMMGAMSKAVVNAGTKDDTIVILLNAGRFHATLTGLSRQANFPIFGSSANLTLSGTKFKVEDIEPEIKAIADVVIDHGLQKFHPYGSSSTLLNVETLEVVRFGSCYEDIAYVLKRHFDITLPPRPGT